MSKSMKVVEQQQKVFSILQSQIEGQRQQTETAQMMLNEMLSIRDEVNSVKTEVGKRFNEMSELVQEVRDSITITNAECTMMQSSVRTKAIVLTKDRYKEEDGDFKSVVGKHIRMIWKQLKEKYDVPKYNCIRRIDFEEAMTFVRDFRPEDYI